MSLGVGWRAADESVVGVAVVGEPVEVSLVVVWVSGLGFVVMLVVVSELGVAVASELCANAGLSGRMMRAATRKAVTQLIATRYV
jgi:hypothetical protein